MFAPEVARSLPALFAAAAPVISGHEKLGDEYLAALWQTGQGGRTCFHHALRASARDIGIASGHAHPALLLEYDRLMRDRSRHPSTPAGWPNVLSGAAAAPRGLFFLPCPNNRNLCLSLCACNQVDRH